MFSKIQDVMNYFFRMLADIDERGRYKRLSLKLYDVMRSIGVTTDVRDTMKSMATIWDFVKTIAHASQYSVHTFGSSCEGTSTEGLGFDVDTVFVSHTPVVTYPVYSLGPYYLIVLKSKLGMLNCRRLERDFRYSMIQVRSRQAECTALRSIGIKECV